MKVKEFQDYTINGEEVRVVNIGEQIISADLNGLNKREFVEFTPVDVRPSSETQKEPLGIFISKVDEDIDGEPSESTQDGNVWNRSSGEQDLATFVDSVIETAESMNGAIRKMQELKQQMDKKDESKSKDN